MREAMVSQIRQARAGQAGGDPATPRCLDVIRSARGMYRPGCGCSHQTIFAHQPACTPRMLFTCNQQFPVRSLFLGSYLQRLPLYLNLVQTPVETVTSHQLLVGALLRDVFALQNNDEIGAANRG